MSESLEFGAVRGAEKRMLPGVPGIWIFVLMDMGFFAMLFLSFVLERAKQPVLFAASQAHLNVSLGLFNMLVLLTSSWFVAMAVHAVRLGRSRQASYLLLAGLACGLVFAAVKVVEYGQKFSAGITPLTDGFFMLYFVMTFLHCLHVIAGVVVLAILALKTRKGVYGVGRAAGIEMGATYWHMVDLLWIMLFPLLYMAK
jgi:nitric oxide reductase NorE protein